VSFILLVENLDALGFELSGEIGSEGALAFDSGLNFARHGQVDRWVDD
jgi:hypothetical protein